MMTILQTIGIVEISFCLAANVCVVLPFRVIVFAEIIIVCRIAGSSPARLNPPFPESLGFDGHALQRAILLALQLGVPLESACASALQLGGSGAHHAQGTGEFGLSDLVGVDS